MSCMLVISLIWPSRDNFKKHTTFTTKITSKQTSTLRHTLFSTRDLNQNQFTIQSSALRLLIYMLHSTQITQMVEKVWSSNIGGSSLFKSNISGIVWNVVCCCTFLILLLWMPRRKTLLRRRVIWKSNSIMQYLM